LSFKDKIIGSRLRKLANSTKRNRTILHWDKIKTVGLLYDASSDLEMRQLNSLSKILGGRKLSIVSYFGEQVPDQEATEGNFYFDQKMTSWLGKPKLNTEEFTNKDFDLLIYFNEGNHIALKYIYYQSTAKLRCGYLNDGITFAHDFSIDSEKNRDLKHLIEQIQHYLTTLKG
jgi:hypothetical protein